MEPYPCTKCGLCCKNLKAILQGNIESGEPGSLFYNESQAFPYTPREDGSCPQLLEDNTCAVYADRPLLCDSGKVYEKYFEGDMSELEYQLLSSFSCNQLINGAGLGSQYMVKIKMPR